jgi:ACS family glucarate transporter-like MFS transporter
MRTTSISAVAVAKLCRRPPFARRLSGALAQGVVGTIAGDIAPAARRDAVTLRCSQAYALRDHRFSEHSRATAAANPAVIVYLIAASGWRALFYTPGAGGIAWAFACYASYRNTPSEYPGVDDAGLALLPAVPIPAQSGWKRAEPWRRILRNRDPRRLSTVYFCYGFVTWLYPGWLPTYLNEARHFAGLKPGLATLPLLVATATNIAGGLLSDRFASQWGDLRLGRIIVSRTAFLIAAVALLPEVLAIQPLAALACLTVAPTGIELTVAVSWAICLDIGGDFGACVSSVMNTGGSRGGAISAVAVGYPTNISDGHRRFCRPAGFACYRPGW